MLSHLKNSCKKYPSRFGKLDKSQSKLSFISAQHTPSVIQSLKNPSECADRLPVDQTS
jgi:hypothetical protein